MVELENIPVINWFEEPVKDSIKSVFNGVNEFVESLDLFSKFRNTHFEMLQEQVGSVKILGMQHPVALKDLYYPASISTDIRRRIYAPEWNNLEDTTNRAARKQTAKVTEPGDGYVARVKRAVILGGPGAGKTTFLKFLALAYSDEAIFKRTRLKTPLLPAYIHLPNLARSGRTILEEVSSRLEVRKGEHARAFYTRLLEHGLCTILLDSLDEVPQELRTETIDKINDFSITYPKCHVLISCRTADYEPVFAGFAEVELARLTPEAIKTIITAWFGRDKERGQKLLGLIANDNAVLSLTETPLLLSLLCIQFKNDLALPKKRSELYRRCVDALLRDWDSSRGFRRDSAYSQLSDDRKERIFESIAGNASSSKSIEYELGEPFILQHLSEELARFSIESNEAKAILREIESHHGILEKCSAQHYEFCHGTMHEYFAARYFVAKRIEFDILKAHYEDEAWHNVILFMVSIMDDPSDLLNYLVARSSMTKFQNYPAFGKRLVHLLLLYRCMASGVLIAPALRLQICAHLVQSQIDMLTQLNADGVLPFAARIPNGVRQAMFSYKKSRPSLIKILRPYRSLMNEIVLSPMNEYADKVIEAVTRLDTDPNLKLFEGLGIKTCILAPISEMKPEFFFKRFIEYSEQMLKVKAENVRSVILESISIHQTMYPELCLSYT